MALARRLDKQPAASRRLTTSAGGQPRSYQLSAQEWAELFPDVPVRLANPPQRHASA